MSRKSYSVIAALIEAALVVAVCMLEHYSGIKAGVNHHLYYRKVQYTAMYLTPDNIKIILWGSIAAAFFSALYMLQAAQNNDRGGVFPAVSCCTWSVLLYCALKFNMGPELAAYPYFILALVICVFVSLLNCLLCSKRG